MKLALLQFYSKNPTPVYDELAQVLRAKGHTVWVGTPDEQGDLAWHDGVSVFHRTRGPGQGAKPGQFLRRRLAQAAYMLRVRSDLARFRPDIAQVNKTTYAGLIPRFLPQGIRCIYDVRQLGLWGGDSRRGRAANKRVLHRLRRNSTRVFDLACYPSALAARRALGDDWSAHAVVTPIGVDRSFLNYEHVPDGPSNSRRVVKFVYVGSIVQGRRLEILLQAASRLIGSGCLLELVLIGPGEGAGHYRQMLGRMGLEGNVEIRPPVPYREVPRVIAQHDVAVAFVPEIEDWKYQVTLKVLEYRALGMPVLASDLPPNREVVADGINGVVAGNTPEEFASGMKRFLDDPAFLNSCRRNARSMRQGKTWEDVARVHEEEVYRRVLGMS